MFASRHSRDLKLTDLGLAQRVDPGEMARVMFSTGEYAAPELISYEPVSFATDMWSLGVVAYVA